MTAIVEGVRMGLADMISHYRRRTTAESDLRRANGLSGRTRREWPALDPDLKGGLWDRIQAARDRVAAADLQGPTK